MNTGGSLTPNEVKDVIKKRELDKISKIYCYATKYSDGMHLSDACINMSISEYVNFLESVGYNKFILITRQNHLKRVISILKGRSSNVWHSTEKTDTIEKIYIPVNDFEFGFGKHCSLLEYFHKMDLETKEIKDSIGGKYLLHLEYENDIETSPLKAYKKICEFSQIKPLDSKITLKKTNPFPSREIISNLDEVENELKGTSYSWMLND